MVSGEDGDMNEMTLPSRHMEVWGRARYLSVTEAPTFNLEALCLCIKHTLTMRVCVSACTGGVISVSKTIRQGCWMDRNNQIMTIIFNFKNISETELFDALTIDITMLIYPANKIGWANAALMMADSPRRWNNRKTNIGSMFLRFRYYIGTCLRW